MGTSGLSPGKVVGVLIMALFAVIALGVIAQQIVTTVLTEGTQPTANRMIDGGKEGVPSTGTADNGWPTTAGTDTIQDGDLGAVAWANAVCESTSGTLYRGEADLDEWTVIVAANAAITSVTIGTDACNWVAVFPGVNALAVVVPLFMLAGLAIIIWRRFGGSVGGSGM